MAKLILELGRTLIQIVRKEESRFCEKNNLGCKLHYV